MKGVFITFEGPDGAGKTTQLHLLADRLRQRGLTIIVTREPGGTEIGDQIRSVLLSPGNTGMVDQAEVLLYAASRAQHVQEKILPALRQNQIVLCDRYIDASLAYQAYGLGVSERAVRAVNEFASSGLQPDRTYYLDVPVEISRKRLLQRSGQSMAGLDRIERKDQDYHERVHAGFEQIAKDSPERVLRVDADRTAEEIAAEIWADCLALLAR